MVVIAFLCVANLDLLWWSSIQVLTTANPAELPTDGEEIQLAWAIHARAHPLH